MDKESPTPLDELIYGRRSIRKYKIDIPPAEWIEKMIHCATRAPSPSNTQPVRFLKISTKNVREELYRGMASGRDSYLRAVEESGGSRRLKNWINSYYRFSEFMFKAPLLFAVGTIASTTGFSKKLFEAGLLNHYERRKDLDISLGLALQGFILKGAELGLGSCVLTAPLVFISNIERIFGIEDLDIRCLVTVGFPDEVPEPIERKHISEVYWEA